MDLFVNALVSWKTTILGVSAILGVLAKWATAGAIDYGDIPVLIAGMTGIAAKDANITGVK